MTFIVSYIIDMSIKQTMVVFAILAGIGSIFASPLVSAACGGVDTSIINCGQDGSGKCPGGEIISKEEMDKNTKCPDKSTPEVIVSNTGIWGILLLAINILTAGIGVAAVGGVVYGSILYTTAGGSPEQVKKARTVIINTVVGLILYALMFSFLNFIIPGGMFSASTSLSTDTNVGSVDVLHKQIGMVLEIT